MISKNGEKVKISKKRKNTLTKWALNQKKCAETDLIHDLRKGDDKYFELKEVEYPFGKRKVFFRKDQEKSRLRRKRRFAEFRSSATQDLPGQAQYANIGVYIYLSPN